MMISKYFELDEFLRSEIAARYGIDMTPPSTVVINLRTLAQELLDPIRDAAQGPIAVSSGYRPRALNTAVQGARDSDHVYGCAADVHWPGHAPQQLMELVNRLKVPALHQAIIEFGSWVHLAIARPGSKPAAEYLTASRPESGGVFYKPWQEA